jgi:CHAD domain-containing protein
MMRPRLAAMHRSLEAVRGSQDPEAIHQCRVASRRLRSALGLFQDVFGKRARKWRRKIRDTASALGRVRDLDVQAAFLEGFLSGLREPRVRRGPLSLLRRIAADRHAEMEELRSNIDALARSKILDRIGACLRRKTAAPSKARHPRPSTLSGPARRTIERLLDELLSYEEALFDPARAEETHRMRISAKRFRYTLEIFAAGDSRLRKPLSAAEKLQGLLGDLHDCDVWLERLEKAALPEPSTGKARRGAGTAMGLALLRRDREIERARIHERVLALWARLRRKGVWSKLRRRLRSKGSKPAGEVS